MAVRMTRFLRVTLPIFTGENRDEYLSCIFLILPFSKRVDRISFVLMSKLYIEQSGFGTMRFRQITCGHTVRMTKEQS